MTKQFRKLLGFKSATTTKVFLTAKDIVKINWELIESYNDRLLDIFDRLQNTLPYSQQNLRTVVQDAYSTIRQHDILTRLNNHGRTPESVYFSWMQGYLSAIVFQPLIESELQCQLEQNGADDLSKPDTFARKSDPDLVDHRKKLFVEIQSGFRGSAMDIKKSKVKAPTEYEYYIASFDCFNGRYCVLNTRDLLNLSEDEWYVNPRWEGALCYTVPENRLKTWI